ncbi:hypothetical protein Cs308_0099 [Candidatus Chlamydia sanziniae]|uniref:Uncharacterized protein n=1 Tax=Candidatus Chlamydia sanziniae TaxID=1806891 RepID=A0A1A9HTE9_9CHLA|nr:hypothetical protein Cs308_0099 [Candidatus Chlamydia sanziniae]
MFFPQIALWAGIVGVFLGFLLLYLTCVVAAYALSFKKVPELKYPQWTEKRDVLGDNVWKKELTELFLQGHFAQKLAVYHADNSLDCIQTLKNILELDPIATCFTLLNKERISTNILLHLIRQWNKLEDKLQQRTSPEHISQLFHRLVELAHFSPEMISLLYYAGAFDPKRSPILEYAKQGKFCVETDGTFSYEFLEEPLSAKKALKQLDRLLALKNPDIRFCRGAFLNYIHTFEFFAAFLHEHFKSLEQRSEKDLDVKAYVQRIDMFLACYKAQIEKISSSVLDWGYIFLDGEKCAATVEQLYSESYGNFSSSNQALEQLIVHGSMFADLADSCPWVLENYTKLLEDHRRTFASITEFMNPRSYTSIAQVFERWVSMLHILQIEGETEDMNYTIALDGLDRALCWFAARVQQEKEAVTKHSVFWNASQWIQWVRELVEVRFSFTATKTLIRLLNIREAIWKEALPLFEGTVIYEELKDFIEGGQLS